MYSLGGSATVVDMSGGTQIVRVSGNGMIETLNGGEQNIMGEVQVWSVQ